MDGLILARIRLRYWLKARLVFAAGLALILAGILCLCLSGAVVTGWWQGTLDAFGVGFVVGGVVDVLAMSGLNQFSRKSEIDREADTILNPAYLRHWKPGEQAQRAAALLDRGGNLLEPIQRENLWRVVRDPVPPAE